MNNNWGINWGDVQIFDAFKMFLLASCLNNPWNEAVCSFWILHTSLQKSSMFLGPSRWKEICYSYIAVWITISWKQHLRDKHLHCEKLYHFFWINQNMDCTMQSWSHRQSPKTEKTLTFPLFCKNTCTCQIGKTQEFGYTMKWYYQKMGESLSWQVWDVALLFPDIQRRYLLQESLSYSNVQTTSFRHSRLRIVDHDPRRNGLAQRSTKSTHACLLNLLCMSCVV